MSGKKLIAVSASPDLQETVGLYIEEDEILLSFLFTVKTSDSGGRITIVYQGPYFSCAVEQYKYEREMKNFKDHLIRL